MMKRRLDILAALAVLWALLWFSVPSSLFIQPVALGYTPETRTFTFTREIGTWFRTKREAPEGTPSSDGYPARWWSEIVVVGLGDSALECSSGAARSSFYQETPGNTVQFTLSTWADPCLSAGPPFYVVTYRQVMLFGWLPLRPSDSRSDIQGVRPEEVQLSGVDEG